MNENANTENMQHVFSFLPPYDGRCMFCDIRPYGVAIEAKPHCDAR